MFAPLEEWNRLHYYDSDGYSIWLLSGSREYLIEPWTNLEGTRRGYFLQVADAEQNTRHEIMPRGKAEPVAFMPRNLYRTKTAAWRAAKQHAAKA